VREYWFGAQPLTAEALASRFEFWFGPEGERHDAQIRERFGALLARAVAGELSAWGDGPRRRLSLILLLDQFPRNMFRGTARAFEYDEQALTLALTGMQSGAEGALDFAERLFFYMPLQHAENRDAQDESVAAYRRLLAEVPPGINAIFVRTLESAEKHRAIIERFGRFPHRNALLERASTPEEVEWLKEGADFGQ